MLDIFIAFVIAVSFTALTICWVWLENIIFRKKFKHIFDWNNDWTIHRIEWILYNRNYILSNGYRSNTEPIQIRFYAYSEYSHCIMIYYERGVAKFWKILPIEFKDSITTISYTSQEIRLDFSCSTKILFPYLHSISLFPKLIEIIDWK